MGIVLPLTKERDREGGREMGSRAGAAWIATAMLMAAGFGALAAEPPTAYSLLPTPCNSAAEPPTIPVGLDAYRQWERWAYQRIGVRAYMRSTYDRAGGNESADASHFLYQLADDRNVTLDVEGAGVLYFVRTNHWHGSPCHYLIDGPDHPINENSTPNPNHPLPRPTL